MLVNAAALYQEIKWNRKCEPSTEISKKCGDMPGSPHMITIKSEKVCYNRMA